MKTLIALTLGTLIIAQPSLARRGGGNGGDTDLITRGSAAWFAAESIEHTVEGLVGAGAITQAGLTSVSVNLSSASTTEVTLNSNIGWVAGTCRMFDESSRRGTIIKKDVRCAGVADASRLDLTRGSDAWAVVEGMEHSLRHAIAADASVLGLVNSASSSLQGSEAVIVSFGLLNSSQLDYVCSRLYYGQPNATTLNCVPLN